MKVQNVSARLHHVGNIFIIPGETAEIPELFRNSINKLELVEVVETVAETVVEKKAAPKAVKEKAAPEVAVKEEVTNNPFAKK